MSLFVPLLFSFLAPKKPHPKKSSGQPPSPRAGAGEVLGSKNMGCFPKWMVKIMEHPIKIDDLGGKHTIFGNTHLIASKAIFSQKSWLMQEGLTKRQAGDKEAFVPKPVLYLFCG